MYEPKEDILKNILTTMRRHSEYFAENDQVDGLVISGLVHIIANVSDNITTRKNGEDELSGPRIWLLVRLADEELRGNRQGLTPTMLSRGQHVSRNTISALLRGLEEQGYIERTLDPNDHRLFHIRITDNGREQVRMRAPQAVSHANAMVANFTPEERKELIRLLGKLFLSVHACAHAASEESRENELEEAKNS